MMNRRAFLGLLFWLGGILFPAAWLGSYSPSYRQIFNQIFGPEWMHWVMHAGLFAGLVLLVFAMLRRPESIPLALGALGVVLLAGLCQEGLQALASGFFSARGSVFDLGIDLLGGLLGLAAAARLKPIRPDSVDS